MDRLNFAPSGYLHRRSAVLVLGRIVTLTKLSNQSVSLQ